MVADAGNDRSSWVYWSLMHLYDPISITEGEGTAGNGEESGEVQS
jgi:hypothetical protein